MTIVDWIILALLVGALIGGFAQGFLRTVFSLGGLVLGLVLAAWNYQSLGAMLKRVIHSGQTSNVVAFLLIAVLVAAVAGIIGSALSKAVHTIGLGCLDRIAGALFGLVQGAVIITLCILVTVAFYPDAQWLTESRLPKYFFGACHLSTHLSPRMLAERVRKDLKTLEEASPNWMHPRNGGL